MATRHHASETSTVSGSRRERVPSPTVLATSTAVQAADVVRTTSMATPRPDAVVPPSVLNPARDEVERFAIAEGGRRVRVTNRGDGAAGARGGSIPRLVRNL